MSARRITATLITAALGLGTVAASDDSPYTNLSDISVEVDGGTVAVSGSIEFGGIAEFLAFEDASGDSLLPGQGFDMTAGTIIQDGSSLVFRMDLGDVLAGDVQPGALFNWNIGVSGADEQRLFAWRNDLLNGTPGEWSYSVVTFGDSGFLTSGVSGAFTGDAVEWHVDAAQISASGGDRIGMGVGPITASQGGGGAIQLTEFVDYDTAAWSADGSFTVGGGVQLTLFNDDEEFTASAKTRRDVFSASFKDVPAGTYTLELLSVFGDAETVETRTVKVA